MWDAYAGGYTGFSLEYDFGIGELCQKIIHQSAFFPSFILQQNGCYRDY